jgi:hypothetical protein
LKFNVLFLSDHAAISRLAVELNETVNQQLFPQLAQT